MPTVRTTVDDATYKTLVEMRKTSGLPSVSALFLQSCGLLDDEREAGEIVRTALKMAKAKPSGFIFRLRDLFPEDRWNAFSKGARLRAGRRFFDVISAATHGIRASHKSGSNHQYYVIA